MFDIIVYGATGFTGARAARYLAKAHGVSLAIAGRDQAKLTAIQKSLGRDVSVIVASTADPPWLDCKVSQGRVFVL
jgi:short subunit dehydrogenase-like uncharacterized protein